MFKHRTLLLVALMVVLGLVLAACGTAEPETVIVTQVVRETVVETRVVVEEGEEVVVEVTREVEVVREVEVPSEETVAEGEPSDVYTIGIFEDPLGLNYWNYLGPGSSVWTQYVLAGVAPSLYTLSDQRFDFVPALAADLPPDPTEEADGTFTIAVPMIETATWSDGEPITAEDVAFTMNTCLNLSLTSNWPNACRPEVLLSAEAVDDYTVKFTFSAVPGLAQWQFGVAQGPILPQHFWAEAVAEASAFVEGLEQPEVCGDEAAEEDQAACEAFENARTTLYNADPSGMPTGGGFSTDTFEPGAFVERTANPNYVFAGAEVIEYSDGTWTQNLADGTSRSFYGESAGDVTLQYTGGPHVDTVFFTLYGDQNAAFLAMQEGEVDYVMNPLSLARGLREQTEAVPEVTTIINADNGLFYLAFNMRKAPYSDQAFRDAVEVAIDKEFVANNILQGSVIPAYSVVPPGNAFWFNADVTSSSIGKSRDERVNEAITILKEAGYSWTTEPRFDADLDDVVPGEGLTLPSGEPMGKIVVLGPGPSYDPQRASFNQWITEWMRELGMPAESELTGFNTILTPVFVEATFDMYILGWSLTIYPDYLCDFFDSRNDTATTGNFNTPGHNDPAFDALCDEFLAETNIEAAQAQARELQQILAQNLPYIPLFYRQSIDLVRTNVKFPYTEVLGGIESTSGFQADAQVFK